MGLEDFEKMRGECFGLLFVVSDLSLILLWIQIMDISKNIEENL